MYSPRTDLALEAHEIAKGESSSPIDGVIIDTENISGFNSTKVRITNDSAKEKTGKDIGTYYTLDIGKIWNMSSADMINASKAVSVLIGKLCDGHIGKYQTALIVGLGNITITADAIGPKALSHIIVTRHIKNSNPKLFSDLELFDIAAISPGVLSQTGIETYEIIKSTVDRINPSLVIAIDSLASKSLSRLATTIQLSDTGIAPGSGMGNRRATLNIDTVGIPVISIGVPTVVDISCIASEAIEKLTDYPNESKIKAIERTQSDKTISNFFVTPKDTDLIIGSIAKIIGYGINLAFHDKLDFEEMTTLAN